MPKRIEDTLFEIERTYAVDSIEYKGIKLWPFLRATIYSSKFSETQNRNSVAPTKRIRKVYDRIVSSLNGFLLTDYSLLNKRDKYLIFSTNYQAYEENGRIINRLTKAIEDNIVDFIPILQINVKKSRLMYGRHYINERLFTDIIAFNAKKCYIKEKDVSNVIILKNIVKELDLEFDYLKYISLISAGIDFYYKWFKAITPKAIFLECYYDTKMCASFAAKKLGIPTVEIQHGIINEKCFEYNCMKAISINPYPDWLFSNGKAEVDTIGNHNIYRKEQIIPIGSYFIDKKRKEQRSNLFFEKRKQNKIIVAVIGQYTIDDKLLPIIQNMASKDTNIFYIFVPRVMDDNYKAYECENICIENRYDVYSIMESSDVVITVYSTCGIEAVALGVPVIVIDIDGLGSCYYSDYARKINSIKIVSDEKSIISEIRKSRYKNTICGDEVGYFFCLNHFDRVKLGLENILGDTLYKKNGYIE